MMGTYAENLPRLYCAALARAAHSAKVNEGLKRENMSLQMELKLLRETVEEQRQLLRAMEEGYSMRRTA